MGPRANLGCDLGLDSDPTKFQLDGERSFVDSLEMAGPKCSVNRDRRSDDDAGKAVGGLSWFSIDPRLGSLRFLGAHPLRIGNSSYRLPPKAQPARGRLSEIIAISPTP